MNMRRKWLLLAWLGLLNVMLFTSNPAKAAAEQTWPNDGLCGLCYRPSGAVDHCCQLVACGGSGQPKCDCANATQCS
jgi:hypothetical protein